MFGMLVLPLFYFIGALGAPKESPGKGNSPVSAPLMCARLAAHDPFIFTLGYGSLGPPTL